MSKIIGLRLESAISFPVNAFNDSLGIQQNDELGDSSATKLLLTQMIARASTSLEEETFGR